MPRIGTPLKLELVRQGRTTQWLADEIGHDRSVVSRWVNGGRTPKVGDAQKIAQVLKKDLDELFPPVAEVQAAA